MEQAESLLPVNKLLANIAKFVSVYLAVPEDQAVSKGNVSVCIIDEEGEVHGKMFGTDKLKNRETFKIAWTKASQVWITGYKTNEYEKLVFTDKIDYHTFGITLPDLVGFKGGQPVTLNDGTKLSVGFSGFRGITDLEIIAKAVEETNKELA